MALVTNGVADNRIGQFRTTKERYELVALLLQYSSQCK